MVSSAIAVVAFKNPIHSALSLVANLLLVAVIYAALEAHFLAAVQIVVYAGAIMVLVIFVLMLINTKVERVPRGTVFYYIMPLTLVIVLAGLAYKIISLSTVSGQAPWAAKVSGTVANMGALLYTEYVFPFEIASVLILAAIAGGVMLGKRQYKR